MVSTWQVLAWIIFGLVVAASALFFVGGLADGLPDFIDRPGPALLGATGLFGCLIVALQIRILGRLNGIDRREDREGNH